MVLRPWQVLARQSLLSVEPWFEVVRERVGLPDGRTIDDYYSVRLPDYAVVVALLPDWRVLVEQHYKHGTRAVTLGLPAGYLNVGENPLLGAQRELREETGYASERWKTLGRFVVDGNRGCGVANFFLAQNCEQVSQPISGDLEEIHLQLMELDEVLNVLRADQPLELCTATALALAYMEIRNYE